VVRTHSSYENLERITRRWWFYLLLLALLFFDPSYSSVAGFVMNERTGELISEILRHALKPYKPHMPVLHVVVILLVAAVLIYGNRVGKSSLLSSELIISS